jgi:hypothetical protein
VATGHKLAKIFLICGVSFASDMSSTDGKFTVPTGKPSPAKCIGWPLNCMAKGYIRLCAWCSQRFRSRSSALGILSPKPFASRDASFRSSPTKLIVVEHDLAWL